MKTAYFLPVLLLSIWCKAQGPYPYTEKGKWGLTDKNKSVLLKPQFDTIDVFRNGFARVESNKRVGLINTSGAVLVNPSYTNITNAFQDFTAIARNIKGYQIIDIRNDKPIGGLFTDILPERSSYPKGSYYFVNKDGKMGIFDAQTGKMQGGKFNQVTGFNDAALDQYALVTLGDTYGVVDVTSGREILKPEYDDIEEVYSGNTVYVAAKKGDDKVFYYDAGFHNASPGNVQDKPTSAIPAESEVLNKRAKDMYIYKLGSGKWRVVLENRETNNYKGLDSTDLNGYTDLEYLSYYPNDNRFPTKIKAVKDGKTGVIDMRGKVLLPFVFEDVHFREDMVGRYAFIETYMGDKKGVVVAADMKELKKPVLKAILDEDRDRNALLIEMPNGQKGYMDKNTGEIFIPGIKE
ncbi:WG repeat-containing protein [Chitinophaga sancti]|uniref:WG repeat-containing protein n=1 Tax=Chitinophaga sancti TaxID=1004 RepID=UPI003F7A58C6